MIVLLNESGQTGNRLRSLSALMALGLENKENVSCPLVDDSLIDNLHMSFTANAPIKVKFENKKRYSVLCKLFRFLRKIKIFRENNISIGNIHIYLDWISFAEPELLSKHYSTVADYFSFKDSLIERCKTIMPRKISNEIKYVAVHLRSGDYKIWNDGKYYYTIEHFLEQMEVLKQENSKVHFLIFSNEIIPEEIIKEKGMQPITTIMKGNVFEDLCCMSMCDFIIGPPSTFSAWAGYIGNTKLIWMNDRTRFYHFTDFKNVPQVIGTKEDFWDL